MPSQRLLIVTALVLLLLGSCSEERGDRKETFPVTGRVVVDGRPPSSPIKITCHNLAGIDKQDPTYSWCMTGEEGRFSLSTYESGDGVPPGEYALTFFWGEMNLISMSYGGQDKLGGQYDSPEESPATFTVKPGEPTDLGKIELATDQKDEG
ncbi:MAG: hypothetical protein ACREJB_05160 [Planctomycetaceae bacterium]